MDKSKLIGIPLITVCMIDGPPAAELMHENKKAGHYEVLPSGSHEHIPVEENTTSQVGEFYTVAVSNYTSLSSVVRAL